MLAVGGNEEIIKIYDLRTKKSCGDLSGEHTSSITCLAATLNHVLSGSNDGQILLWRQKDMVVLHKLTIKNVSKVVSLCMHKSQRMALALYANGMLRLWNLLDARCTFKKRVGLAHELDADEERADDDSADDMEEAAPVSFMKFANTPSLVKWCPFGSADMYVVLFSRSLELYTVEQDTPIHSVNFNTTQTGVDFITDSALVISDDKGRLTLLTGIRTETTMRIIETDFEKFRTVEAHHGDQSADFFCTVSKEGAQFWSTKEVLAKISEGEDAIFKLKPSRSLVLRN